MIIFENVGRTDILAWNLLLYTTQSFLQKITFPFSRYQPPSQQLPKIAKFQFSADFCIFLHFCRKPNAGDKTGLPRKGSNDPLRDRVLGKSDMFFENKRSLRPEHFHPSGGTGEDAWRIMMPRIWRGNALFRHHALRLILLLFSAVWVEKGGQRWAGTSAFSAGKMTREVQFLAVMKIFFLKQRAFSS